ncbi:MAG: hypothetical protein U9Q79_09070 [Candidatus Hydrogenedentes bacterium]|nr:hypothetical protein [Candidatus Hydrogenedentota bacterium]
MSEQTDDILQRLESIVQSWSSEVDAAQRRLGEQLAETRDRLRSSGNAESEVLPAGVVEQLAGMQRMLEDCIEAVREVLTRVDTLEDEVAELKAESRGQEASLEEAPVPEESPSEPAEAIEAPVAESVEQEPLAEEAPVEQPSVEEAGAEEPPAEEPPPQEPTRRVKIQPFDEHGAPRHMGEILVSAGLISQEQLETALALQQENPQRKLGTILVEEGFTGEEVIPQVLARQLRLPYLRLKEEVFDPAAVRLVSGRLAARHACIPVRATADTLALAMANPLDLIAIEDVERAASKRVQPLIARESEIMDAIARWYGTESAEE